MQNKIKYGRAWIVIILTIWNYKNNIIFNNNKVDEEEVLCIVHLYVWVWMTHRIPRTRFFYSYWIQCLKVCLKSLWLHIVLTWIGDFCMCFCILVLDFYISCMWNNTRIYIYVSHPCIYNQAKLQLWVLGTDAVWFYLKEEIYVSVFVLGLYCYTIVVYLLNA